MPRLVRRRPLLERITAALNPWDTFLWLSEEIETRDIGSKSLGTQLGLGLNALFLLARANGAYTAGTGDDVFSDIDSGSWLAYLSWTVAWLLAAISVWNVAPTFLRTRSYRFFEADVEQSMGTPNAKRVRVQSSPALPSPLRVLGDIMSSETAESRAHPDVTRDVWELHLWDPLPASLQILCLFSPVHVLMYMFALPVATLDPRPSVTVFKCIVEQIVLSVLLLTVEAQFTQQNKDAAYIQKEVMREYDIKFVHPHVYPVVREVGTQCGEDDEGNELDSVEIGRPNTLIKRSFQTNPNPNYLAHIDPDKVGQGSPSRSRSPSVMATPVMNRSRQADNITSALRARPSPFRQSVAPATPRTATPRALSPQKPTVSSISTSTNTHYGGNLGVFSHTNSPLKRAAS
ncbi:hypothetical protein BD289DRAFT_269961 [Coniella lustricola]|uniref:Meiotically up-regulated gene 154 protein n=1 Tax=Coniella lustricola TaxID=2025994 RepID=A0A2T3AKD0_9PEZI|nr:hypothetical protein BD289DRAFT_269961 [Coniella lustricola]